MIARAAPVFDADGSIREWIGTITDLEEQWLAEERLRHSERLESIGRLAGGIAHEANNQMTVILGAAEFLGRALTDDTTRADLEHIRRAAQRTAAITQQLLAFSRRQVLQPRPLDLNAVVRAMEAILQRALGEISRVELRLSENLPLVNADPGQLDQVLLNLSLNARDAMPNGGTLTFETATVRVDAGQPAAGGVEVATPGVYVALIATDTGTGMDAETLTHIFEPFYTTKMVGEGTGLGLATVYGIVNQSGGFVSVTSQPGQGSSFRIHLPMAGLASPEPRSRGRTLPGAGGRPFFSPRTSPPFGASSPAPCATMATRCWKDATAPTRSRSRWPRRPRPT